MARVSDAAALGRSATWRALVPAVVGAVFYVAAYAHAQSYIPGNVGDAVAAARGLVTVLLPLVSGYVVTIWIAPALLAESRTHTAAAITAGGARPVALVAAVGGMMPYAVGDLLRHGDFAIVVGASAGDQSAAALAIAAQLLFLALLLAGEIGLFYAGSLAALTLD